MVIQLHNALGHYFSVGAMLVRGMSSRTVCLVLLPMLLLPQKKSPGIKVSIFVLIPVLKVYYVTIPIAFV